MKLLHLTTEKALNSVKKHGILPTPILNKYHKEAFEKYNLLDKNGNGSYLWYNQGSNDKFVKDLIYAKYFIHPRINKMEEIENDYYDKIISWGEVLDKTEHFIRNSHTKLYIKDIRFHLLEIDYNKLSLNGGGWIHWQIPEGGSNRYLNEKFSHQNKKIDIYNKPIKNFKIVESIDVREYKNNDLGFSFRKI